MHRCRALALALLQGASCLRLAARPRAAVRLSFVGGSLEDGRTYRVFLSDAEVADHIKAAVVEAAQESIAERGAFAMSIGSGTTVAPLPDLASSDVDWKQVHLFFGNERTVGDSAYKCYRGAAAFVAACGIPAEQVHRVPDGGGDPDAAAAAYDALMRLLLPSRADGMPRLDLVLLGSGADGHCASLYSGSAQVLQSPGARAVVAAEGKGGVTLSLDAIGAARRVLLSACKPEQAGMAAAALDGHAHGLPSGMVRASSSGEGEAGTAVEWLLTHASAAELLAGVGAAPPGGPSEAERDAMRSAFAASVLAAAPDEAAPADEAAWSDAAAEAAFPDAVVGQTAPDAGADDELGDGFEWGGTF